MAIGHTAVFQAIGPGYDMTRVAGLVSESQSQGAPVAFVGKYFGQFQFLGRLTEPLDVLESFQEIPQWTAAHPNGYLVISRERGELPHQQVTKVVPPHLQDLKANRLEVWSADECAVRVAGHQR